MPREGVDRRSEKAYLKEISKYQPFSAQEEKRIARLVKQGDGHARERFIKANLRFVVQVALEMRDKSKRDNVPLVDFISAGNAGLVIAADRFDPERGFKFISYAVWWIRQAMLQLVTNEEGTLVRVPVNRQEKLQRIYQALNSLQKAKGGHPVDLILAISEETGFSPDDIEQELNAHWAVASMTSLDAGRFEDDPDSESWQARIPDENQRLPDEIVIAEKDKNLLIRCIQENLDERESFIVLNYFGLTGDSLTLEEIGARFNLTRERVRQIKEKALRKFRHPKLARVIRDHLSGSL